MTTTFSTMKIYYYNYIPPSLLQLMMMMTLMPGLGLAAVVAAVYLAKYTGNWF